MRASRLLSILILLQLRLRVTAEELAQEFEVSVRTIYRDVDALSAAGVPIQADRGRGGGFQLMNGYRTRLTGLSADEAEAMLMIGIPGPAAELGLAPAARGAQRKMLASLPESLRTDAGRIGARFHLDPLEWYRAAEPVGHLPALARAVLDQRVVSMTYESWTATRKRRVEPMGLVLKAGAWYLVARSGKSLRTYKVSKILEHVVEDERFERPDDFDLSAHWADSMEQFEARLRPEKASLSCSPIGLRRLAELGEYAARAVREAGAADAKGWRRVELPIESVERAALTLLALGAEFRVVEPAALRERVRELARDVARRMA